VATIKNAKKDAIPFTAENFNQISPDDHVLIRQQQGLFLLIASINNPDEWFWVQCLDEIQMEMILRSTHTIPAVNRRKQKK